MRAKEENPYYGLSHEELLKRQQNLCSGRDCRQYHKALCKVQKEEGVPFYDRGMLLRDRYPLLFPIAALIIATVLTIIGLVLAFR